MKDKSSSLFFLFRNRKFLILSFIIGGALSAGITYFIPKKYMSTAIVYPANSHTRNDIIGNPQFGYETETEQLLQLLESKSMRQRTIDAFDLITYYEIDTTKSGWKTRLDLEYIDDVSFFRSKYLSVVINVTTKDPELSTKIANFQIDEVNAYRDAIFDENRTQELRSVKLKLDESQKSLDLMRDSIYSIRGNSDQLIFNFIENLNNENFDASEFVDNPKLEGLIEKYIFELQVFREFKSVYNKLEYQMNRPMPEIYTIDRAVPSYKKVSPSYLINAILGGFVFLLLSITLLVIRKEFFKLKESEKEHKSAN
jgi:uncharacterized protein involved in exopolysaccharide biosynthesis